MNIRTKREKFQVKRVWELRENDSSDRKKIVDLIVIYFYWINEGKEREFYADISWILWNYHSNVFSQC